MWYKKDDAEFGNIDTFACSNQNLHQIGIIRKIEFHSYDQSVLEGYFELHHLINRIFYYSQTSNISCTLEGNEIVNHSDVVRASPVGAAPTTS